MLCTSAHVGVVARTGAAVDHLVSSASDESNSEPPSRLQIYEQHEQSLLKACNSHLQGLQVGEQTTSGAEGSQWNSELAFRLLRDHAEIARIESEPASPLT